MIPPCQICKEICDDNSKIKEAKILACVTMNFGPSKVTKWMAICEAHYNGGPGYLLTAIPEIFLVKKEQSRT